MKATWSSINWSTVRYFVLSLILLCLAACGRVLQPTLLFSVTNAPGASNFTRCEGGLEARFEVRGQVIFDSSLVPPARNYNEDVKRAADTTDNEPVLLSATCYNADGTERGYTYIATRWQPTVPGASYVNIVGPIRTGGDTSICVRATETRGEPPCIVSPILK